MVMSPSPSPSADPKPRSLALSSEEKINLLFATPMNRREANKRAFDDFDRAVHRFCRPRVIFAKEGHKEIRVDNLNRIVVEVMPTPFERIISWHTNQGETGTEYLFPRWIVRVARDPDQQMRGCKDPVMAGPGYMLGHRDSFGPYTPMSQAIHQLIGN
jgi:hypothetical protein